MKIFSGSSNPNLVKKICEHLGIPQGKVHLNTFPSGEKWARFEHNIRGKDVFLVQSASAPVNDNLMELFIMADAARRASAGEITAVCPMFFYTRQDRKDRPRVPISARLVMDLAKASGIQRIVTMDLHADQIGGFWNKPFDHLQFTPSLIKSVKENVHVDVVVAPDLGSIKRTSTLSKILEVPMAIVVKERLNENNVESKQFIGDVKDKNVLIVDDLTESAGTLVEASKQCKENGASKIFCAVTHGCFTDLGVYRLMDSFSTELIDKLFVSNTIGSSYNWYDDKNNFTDRVIIVDVSPVFAKAILNIHNDESVSELFK
jgi:ribose-phosphate pyrophosphokinase